MEPHGFIRSILDVKILILYVMSLIEKPISAQDIYELCYQDDCLSYFDVKQAIPEMVKTGHLMEVEEDRYAITEKGRETEEITRDGIAFPVMQRAKTAVERRNRKNKREQFLRTDITQNENGDYMVHMGLDDLQGPIMNLEVFAPSLSQARRLERAYMRNAETIYQSVMIGLMEESEREEE